MNEQVESERGALDDLLKSDGWHRYLDHARQEWVTGYPLRLKEAIRAAREKGEDLEAAVQKVDYANDVVNALLSWPKERLQQLASLGEKTSRWSMNRRV